jgi:membrane protease YdiL (CAAX protease family)
MPKRVERLPPSPARVFLLSALALAAYGAYRLFLAKLLPSTAASNVLPQGLAVAAGALACALFLYWLARLRYKRSTLNNRPGSWPAGLALCSGLALAAGSLMLHRPMADWNADNAVTRLAGLAVGLCVAACEETGFRGVLFLAATEWGPKRGPWLAVLLGCLAFVLMHWSYQSPWDLPFAAGAGLALGLARLRGASLPALVAAHALMDAVATLWMPGSLVLSYWNGLSAAGIALALAVLLWFLPKAPPPDLKQA